MRVGRSLLIVLLAAAAAGCAAVRPWERGRLAAPAMQFAIDGYADGQVDTIHEITEGATFAAGGPGAAGAGCGCH